MSHKQYGILVVSHVSEVAEGIVKLVKEVAQDVSITYAGGTDDGGIGSSFEKINHAVGDNEANELFAFYDLGSSKMTLEMVMELSEKEIYLMDTAFIESTYTAAALIQGGSSYEAIMKQLNPLKVK